MFEFRLEKRLKFMTKYDTCSYAELNTFVLRPFSPVNVTAKFVWQMWDLCVDASNPHRWGFNDQRITNIVARIERISSVAFDVCATSYLSFQGCLLSSINYMSRALIFLCASFFEKTIHALGSTASLSRHYRYHFSAL